MRSSARSAGLGERGAERDGPQRILALVLAGGTITGMVGASRRSDSRVAKPSDTPSASGGRPRSSRATAGASARTAASAAARSPARTAFQPEKPQRYCAASAASSSITSSFGLLTR
jgi:hypothetical protein